MSLSQRTDGRWIVKYKDPTGTWKQRSFRDRESAQRFDDDSQYDTAETTRLTLRECVTLFLQSVPHVPSKNEQYSFLVNGHNCKDGTHTEGPAEFLADKYCTDLNRRDLENFRLRLRERGNSTGTINGSVSQLKAAMNWAADQDLIAANPWSKYRALPGHKTKHMSGTLEDFQKLYARLAPWAQWACRTCIALCLRPGKELFSLTWEAFDWKGRYVTVYMPKVNRTKVVYPPEAYLAEAWERCQKAQRQSPVCLSRTGRKLTRRIFWTAWTVARRAQGIDMPPYSMRHIAASQMLYGGADIAAVAAQLGHSSVATTASTYVHAVAAGQKRAAQSLPLLPLVPDGAGIRQ